MNGCVKKRQVGKIFTDVIFTSVDWIMLPIQPVNRLNAHCGLTKDVNVLFILFLLN